MKNAIIILFLIFVYYSAHCCSFIVSPFCNTINEENPNNVILRGYFSSDFVNGLTFTRLETLRGNEERTEIKVWDNISFDCNGLHERKALQMGALNQEIIISLAKVDSIIFGDEILDMDYRVPEGLWWETHSLLVEGDSIVGFYLQSQENSETFESIHYDDFIETIINTPQCINTSIIEYNGKGIKVYPTPANDIIFIEYGADISNGKMLMYDSSGRKIFTKAISPYYNIGMLGQGMYIIVVQTDDNKCYHQKIVKI